MASSVGSGAVQRKFIAGPRLIARPAGDARTVSTGASSPRTELARPDGTPPRALVVDDEPDLARALVRALTSDGWLASSAGTGAQALAAAAELPPDVVLLDVMLPDLDGFEVLRRLREQSEHVCVLFLTARDAVADRVAGISAGGDDYVTKPFSLQEVLARARGLVRRAGLAGSAATHRIRVGDLIIDEDAREVHRGKDRVELTATEFELLLFLARHPRRVLSKAQILDQVWKYDFGGQSHVVELYVSYLRRKIDAGRPPIIHTVRGFGYVLRPVSG